jgi:hypothetical protein
MGPPGLKLCSLVTIVERTPTSTLQVLTNSVGQRGQLAMQPAQYRLYRVALPLGVL